MRADGNTRIDLVACLSDNYAYLLCHGNAVAVIDPSEEAPVVAALAARSLALTHILNTHHHFDHTGGNLALKQRYGARIIGPKADTHRIPGIDEGVGEGDQVSIGGLVGHVIDIPAHTSGHIAFHFPQAAAVFTGDTLFAMGCGRLFEGTPADMWRAMEKLRMLDPATRVYCGHEYTEDNGRFALTIDANNAALRARMAIVSQLRKAGQPTIPSTIADEIATNPFMRADQRELAAHVGMVGEDAAAVLGEIRRRKDVFR